MTFWILVMAVVVLVVFSLVRERFEPTSTIKAPPYDDQEKVRIYSMLSRASGGALMNKAKLDLPNETDDTKLAAKAAGYITPALESFYTTVYRPGTTTLKSANVDTFMQDRTGPLKDIEKEAVTAYFVNQASIASSGYLDVLADLGQTAAYQDEKDRPPPICPAGTILRSEDKRCVSQTAAGTMSCPSGYELDGQTCRRIGGTETTDPTCPTGYAYNSTARVCDSIPVDPTCPGDYEYRDGQCARKTATATPTPGAAVTTGPATTTGGASTSTYGPTTGGASSRIRQVFGPQFTERGNRVSGGGDGDSSQSNIYPELLGGMIDSSSRIPGAGITAPSKNWTLANNGSLPNSTGLGADEMSRYFPFSRSPGDMDVIPDPYRVAQTFSASSYSSKTEPVPFLTDFSAFQK